MSRLLVLQQEFAESSAKLILKALELGYKVTHGETGRSAEEAASNADAGTGISRSLHCEHLAIDLNFFKDGVWVTDGSKLRDIGYWWKSLGPDYRWGGDFKTRPDGNHFSITPDGKRA